MTKILLFLLATAIAWAQAYPGALPNCTSTRTTNCSLKAGADGTVNVGNTVLPTLYDIRAFGATIGATDNSTALQAAINAGITDNVCVYIPAGTWKYSTTLNLYGGTNNTRGPCLQGAGGLCGNAGSTPAATSASCLEYTGTGTAAAGSDGTNTEHGLKVAGVGLKCNNASGCSVAWDLTGTNTVRLEDAGAYYGTSSTGWSNSSAYQFVTALKIYNASQINIVYPWVSGVSTAVDIQASSNVSIEKADFYQALKCFHFSGSGTNILVANGHNFEMCDVGISVDDTVAGSQPYSAIAFRNNTWLFNPQFGFPSTNRQLFVATTSSTNGLIWNAEFAGNQVTWLSSYGVSYPFDASGLAGSGATYGHFSIHDNLIGGSTPAQTALYTGTKLQWDAKGNVGLSAAADPGQQLFGQIAGSGGSNTWSWNWLAGILAPLTPNTYDLCDVTNTCRSIYVGTKLNLGAGAKVTGGGSGGLSVDSSGNGILTGTLTANSLPTGCAQLPCTVASASTTYTATQAAQTLIASATAGLYQIVYYYWSSTPYGGTGANCAITFSGNNGNYGTSPAGPTIGLTGAADTVSGHSIMMHLGAGQALTYTPTITAASPTGNCNVDIAVLRVR